MAGKWLARLMVVAALALALIGPGAGARAEGGVPFPVIAKAQGETCVEDPAVMRRDHMKFLMHTRDDTLRSGIRGAKYDLGQCLTCHAVADPASGRPVTVQDERHFCVTCHVYAAVQPDCFQCHTSVPGEQSAAGQ